MSSSASAPAPAAGAPPARRWRLAVLMTHPIQYLVPLVRLLAQHPAIDLMVYFMSDHGLRPRTIEGFGEALVWDMPLLDGYRHELLPNRSPWPDRQGILQRVNPGVVAALARGRFDALLLHGYGSASEWMAYAAATALRIPILFWGDVVQTSYIERSEILRRAFRRAFCAGLAAALAPSRAAYAFYEASGLPRERVFWAPLCVDNETWMKRSDALRPRRAELKGELGLDPALPVVLLVAHLREVKRPLDVLDALARMKTPASLVVVGGGPLFEAVERRAREPGGRAVHLAGIRNQGELARYYAAADVFTLSSTHEVNPLVIREAMCSSLPLVISSGVTVAAEFVREGEDGFTYPVGDVGALAARLDDVLADPATTARMSARSRELIAPWTYDVTVEGIVEALASLRRPGA